MLHCSTPCMRWCPGSCHLSLCGSSVPQSWQCNCKAKHHKWVHAALPVGYFTYYFNDYATGNSRHLDPVNHARRTSCSAQTLAKQLVLTGDTPVGQGLLSCEACQRGTALLEVPLSEVVAITEPQLKAKLRNAELSAATAAYSTMPKKLLQFVQGRT